MTKGVRLKPLKWTKLHENHFAADTFGDTEIEVWLDESVDANEDKLPWLWGWVTPKTEDQFPDSASSLEEAKSLAENWHYAQISKWVLD